MRLPDHSRSGSLQGQRRRAEPDWAHPARELKRPGVTLMILWEEYRAAIPDGYGYSRFCDLFREFERRLSPVMRQQHNAGEKVFVDYSGKRLPIAEHASPFDDRALRSDVMVVVREIAELGIAA